MPKYVVRERKKNGEYKVEQGFIFGNEDIARYCGVSAITIWNWRRKHGFPAAPLPDGRIATTKSLIDQWLLARTETWCSETQATSSGTESVDEAA